MAHNTFHLFSLLPGELRDQIWDFTVRPQGFRGVQYFSLFGRDEIPEKYKDHLIKPWKKSQWQILGAPLPANETPSPSWNNNPSTYAIDGGLWVACKEFRAAMHRRYKPESWVDFYRRQREGMNWWADRHMAKYEKDNDIPFTFAVDVDSRSQFFTILPAKDLIYIQSQLTAVELPFLWHHMPRTLNFIDVRRFGGYRTAQLGDQVDCIVWLVDHRLRRKCTALNEQTMHVVPESFWKSEQIVFHGNGCKYYAVPESYGYLFFGYDEETQEDGGVEPVSDFIYHLVGIGTRQEAIEDRIDEEEVRPLNEFGVLVCERDG
ncbi:hypothetical protein CI238_01292 [Colletotrichum incanum]|uniref:2EXR domain-containing protein n=1 Tax=Colletotrichum incanum TaxID=1573173 RepID=A0A166ZWC5_COLIC|nr:hypothetical protein CI238_01292 [Colletotrichum incanum]